jgi:hypothetical protein
MKPQDYAIPTLALSILIGFMCCLGGYLLIGAVVVLVGLLLSNQMWQPVRDGEQKATAYLMAHQTEKRWAAIRAGMDQPQKGEEEIPGLNFDQYVSRIKKLYQDAGFYRVSLEKEYHYLRGAGFIVTTAEGPEGSQDSDGKPLDMGEVVYLDV